MTSPTHSDMQRDMGRMEAGLEALKDAVEKGFSETGQRIEKVENRLASLETIENKRSGAFSLGHWLVGLIGGAVVFLADHLWR